MTSRPLARLYFSYAIAPYCAGVVAPAERAGRGAAAYAFAVPRAGATQALAMSAQRQRVILRRFMGRDYDESRQRSQCRGVVLAALSGAVLRITKVHRLGGQDVAAVSRSTPRRWHATRIWQWPSPAAPTRNVRRSAGATACCGLGRNTQSQSDAVVARPWLRGSAALRDRGSSRRSALVPSQNKQRDRRTAETTGGSRIGELRSFHYECRGACP